MIKLTEILKAVNLKLADRTGLKVNSFGRKELINRPSLKSNFDNLQFGPMGMTLYQRTGNLRIYYFANTDRDNAIELLDMQEILSALFYREIYIKDDYYMYLNDLQFDILEDDILVMDAVISLMDEVEDDLNGDNKEYMEELIDNYEVL